MIYNIVIASIALLSVVNAGSIHGGPGHHRAPPSPPFLKNVTEEERKVFNAFFESGNLTIADLEIQVGDWAKTNGIFDEFTAFEANLTAHKAEVRQNTTAVINKLLSVQSELETILADKNLTWQSQEDAITDLRTQYPQEVDSIFFIDGTGEEKPKGPNESAQLGELRGPEGKRK